MRRALRSVWWIPVVLAWCLLPARATVGLAEWDVQTPGKNWVSHSDPYIADHGTCLRSTETAPGGKGPTVYISHIEWWQYYKGLVVGKTKRGFFVFDETKREALVFTTEAEMTARIRTVSKGPPQTRRLTPEDGWGLVWFPVLRQRLEELKKSDEYKTMSEAQKQALDKQVKEFQGPDIRP